MRKQTRFLVHSAIIAALYTVLCYLQNLIFPDSASMAIQFRAAEALCVLVFFTPAAIPGLGLGCLLFNISFAGALPLDFLVGTLASVLAAAGNRPADARYFQCIPGRLGAYGLYRRWVLAERPVRGSGRMGRAADSGCVTVQRDPKPQPGCKTIRIKSSLLR